MNVDLKYATELREQFAARLAVVACVLFAVAMVRFLSEPRPSMGDVRLGRTEYMVDLNSATYGELLALPDVGPALAKRIIEYRDSISQFKSINDLQRVRGVGIKTMQNLRPMLRVAPPNIP